MKKRILAFLTSLILLLSVIPATKLSTAYAYGTTDWDALTQVGSFARNGVYYISNAKELGQFRDMINALSNDSTSYSCTFYLTADIVLNEPESFLYDNKGHIRGTATDVLKWSSIGNYSIPFKGTFDGQGHTISGLYCDVRTGDVGLFGYLAGGSAVRNVHITNAYLYTSDGDAGGISSSAGMTNISNCSFEGFLYASGTGSAANSAGGIVGYLQWGSIDNCRVNASVVSYSAGGIAGTVKDSPAQVTNCFTTGQVSALNDNLAVGGIVGQLSPPAAVRNCGSTMDIFATYGSGICGRSGSSGGNCTIENCWFGGKFTGDAVASPTLAGITVIFENFEQYVSVLNCYASARSSTYLFRSSSYRQDPDQGENGGGMFDPATGIVTATTSDGFKGYWQDGVFCTVTDTPYVLSGSTDLVTALNGWVAAQSDGSYRLWALGEDGLPEFCSDSWSDAAAGLRRHSGDTVRITSAEELAQLAALVNSGTSFADKTVVLENSIDLRGRYWTPIGTEESPFDGTFDGAGHTVSNMIVSSSDSCQGLFGCSTGEVRNVRVENATVIGGNSTGGIVGSTDAAVDSCSFSGAVHGAAGIGGIVGSTGSTVYNSRNSGIITGSSTVGAVAGSNSGTVGNCFSTGAVHTRSAFRRMASIFYSNEARETSFDLSSCYGSIAGSGTVDSSYDASAVSVDNSILLDALSAAAAGNPAYTPWTYNSAANDGLPYYAAFSGGSGAEEDPWRITTTEQLAYLATLVNAGSDQEGSYYQLDADLVFNEGYFDDNGQWYSSGGKARTNEQPLLWTPIGSEENTFAGSFDGAGHTISGLYCPDDIGGLFGHLSGSLSNLLLADGYFSGSGTAAAGQADGSVLNCGSTCAGSGGGLSGTNCWDSSDAPSLAALNSWVERNGEDYHLWYALPDSDLPSFRPALLPIVFTLNGGKLDDSFAYFHYGEALTLPAAPVRTGYTFAGWSVYPNESGSGSNTPAAMFVTDSIDVSNARTLRLEALWAEDGVTLLDYCTLTDGVYVLDRDVILAEEAVFSADTVLDLNGHTIGGISDHALLWADGCRLELRNSGADTALQTNVALGDGLGGEILIPGSDVDLQETRITVPSGENVVTLTVFSPAAGECGIAYKASYNDAGRMLKISAHPDGSAESAVFLITAEEAGQTRAFILPDSWLLP